MSSAVDATEAFLANLRGCGLLKSQQLQEFETWANANQPDVQGIARELNRRGWLSAFQIKEIYRGNGLRIGRYVLLELVGEGGMGRVYKAHDTRMGRDVALKIIRREKLKHPAAETRFKHEIEALAKMKHPNVVQVFNADQVGDTHYYEMEFVDGSDLTRLVRERGALPVHEACEYIRQAALGLEHAFEMGLVHRDIKPSNILVSRNGKVVKLVDLGLARLLEHDRASGRVTQEGFVIGTPDFLAPEQARDPTCVDIRADIYALGGTLYFLLTGKVPYDGANPTEKLIKHCTDPPPSLLAARPDAPPLVDQIIQWAMAKQPELRPQTPIQLAQALAPFCQPGAAPAHFAVPHPVFMPLSPISPMSPMPAPPAEPSSAVLFRLPPQVVSADPIRRRAEPRFPLAYALVALGGLIVTAILGYALYLALLPKTIPPIDSFTTSERSGAIRMVKLDGGTFRMGSPETEPGRKSDEGPPHDVTLTGPILISAGEISQSQYLKVVGANPAKSAQNAHRAQNRPVDWVSWIEASEFCKKLTEMEAQEPWARKGWAFRLPTEAEWEFAARAGTDTPYAFGDQVIFERHALFNWSEDDPRGVLSSERDPAKPPKSPIFPQEVGKSEPNRFGLCDLHGNVAEWCLDWYRPIYPDGAVENPAGPASGDRRVIRGGSFRSSATETRSAARSSARPDARRDDVGFRVVYAPEGK